MIDVGFVWACSRRNYFQCPENPFDLVTGFEIT